MTHQQDAHRYQIAAMCAEGAGHLGTARAMYEIARDEWRAICEERGHAIMNGIDQGPLSIMQVVNRAGDCAAGMARTGAAMGVAS